MNSTTPPPAVPDGDVAVGYVLVPFFLFTIIGIVVAVIMYIRKKKRYDVQPQLTDFAISFCQFTPMIPQRNSMKPSKKCYGEKRTQGLCMAGLEVINSGGLSSGKMWLYDSSCPEHIALSDLSSTFSR
ncbi:hypothetical protein fugu_007056 [Takifugu bimaculatus]|uniref:Uncharacterized protein n=1 Tax=Takifugu bimaculatus TaxID=433685 RepID=A0A4Z2B5E2_9TELE|nr:hypothetical protein fugu_007056 [Takifugu bimaculatus]